MKIYKINLNLLKVFHVLMQTQHVSRAAKKLHITQPAITNSLNQLREVLHDELLIRGPKGMVPTQKALSMAPRVEQVLRQMETVFFYDEAFNFKTEQRTFVIGMNDYAEFVLLPKLYYALNEVAPNISLNIVSCREFTPEKFKVEGMELGVGAERKFSTQLKHEVLFSDEAVCVAREENPIFLQPITLETFIKSDHLAVHSRAEELTLTERALKTKNLQRNIKITLPDMLPALQTLSTSNLIATFPKNVAIEAEKVYHLKYFTPPFEMWKINLVQVWHRQQEKDSGLIWLRNFIKDVCKEFRTQ